MQGEQDWSSQLDFFWGQNFQKEQAREEKEESQKQIT